MGKHLKEAQMSNEFDIEKAKVAALNVRPDFVQWEGWQEVEVES